MEDLEFVYGGAESPMGLLYDHLNQLQQSEYTYQGSMTNFLNLPSVANGAAMTEVLTKHVQRLSDTVGFVAKDRDMDADEKSKIIANIIITDDRNRVIFLNQMCGGEAESAFTYGYDELGTTQESIKDLFVGTDQTDEEVEEIVRIHVEFINQDVQKFMRDPLVESNMEVYEKAQELRQKLGNFAKTAAAAALGTSLAIWWSKKHRT